MGRSVFEDIPTSEHWLLSAQDGALSFEHVLQEAGEQRSDDSVARETTRARLRSPSYYSELLFVLTHQRYAPEEAFDVWQRILRHRDELGSALGRNPGVAVAALDYLSNFEGRRVRLTLIDDLKLNKLVDSATRDSLTGLYDRGTLRTSIKQALTNLAEPMCVIMIDLDHFKRFNDAHGHLEGDRVLIKVSAIVRDSVRDTDVPARYGGEELCVLLKGRGLAEAEAVAERLRSRIENELHDEGVTASMGVACFPDHGLQPSALLDAADKALYVSKRAGRNRVSRALARN